MIDASDVAITILTGSRPKLLDQTLLSILEFEEGLLETGWISVLHNGSDDQTAMILETRLKRIDRIRRTHDLLPIGPATSILAEEAAGSGRRFWLHLEDDWLATGDQPGWLEISRALLRDDPDLAQVRLRRSSEKVLDRHMVTRRPISWKDHGPFRISPDAHWTNNPALMRCSEASLAWPAGGEKEAQRRWHEAGRKKIAQLDPGVFIHLGDDLSLRKKTGSPL
jgi:hypothetical protein